MKKQWNIKPKANEQLVAELQESLGVAKIVAELLVQRGITTFETAKTFFRPELSHLHDPFLMKDMHSAVARLSKAIQQGENILVYGDYDVDGTTAVFVDGILASELAAEVVGNVLLVASWWRERSIVIRAVSSDAVRQYTSAPTARVTAGQQKLSPQPDHCRMNSENIGARKPGIFAQVFANEDKSVASAPPTSR